MRTHKPLSTLTAVLSLAATMTLAAPSFGAGDATGQTSQSQALAKFPTKTLFIETNLAEVLSKAPAKLLQYLVMNPRDPAGEAKLIAPYLTPVVIANSFTTPQPLYNKANMMAGGYDVFHGDLFTEGFFRQNINNHPGTSLKLSEVTKGQPWLEWDKEKGLYVFRDEGAQERLISRLGDGLVSLYRGTSQLEMETILAIKILSKKNLVPKLRDLAVTYLEDALEAPNADAPYKSVLRKAVVLLKDSSTKQETLRAFAPELEKAYLDFLVRIDKTLFFFTPDVNKAMTWSKGTVMRIDFQAGDLLRLSKKKELYAGIEYDYVEIALGGSEAVHHYITNARVKVVKNAPQVQGSGNQFEIVNPDEEPVIQGTVNIVSPEDP